MSDVRELVEWLRASGTANAPRNSNGIYMSICDEAADALEAAHAENARLREALRRIASRNFVYLTNSRSDNPAEDVARSLYREWKAIIDIARAALKAEPVEP